MAAGRHGQHWGHLAAQGRSWHCCLRKAEQTWWKTSLGPPREGGSVARMQGRNGGLLVPELALNLLCLITQSSPSSEARRTIAPSPGESPTLSSSRPRPAASHTSCPSPTPLPGQSESCLVTAS